MEKLDMMSKDVKKDIVEILKELMPNVVFESADGEYNIDFDALKQEINAKVVNERKEKYELTWPGKSDAVANANTPINKTLRPCFDKSLNFETTKNIYIEGDNLEALKILQESYLGKIKCIYIDPPYNTGNDFVYNDAFVNENELLDSGLIDEYNNRLFTNNNSNGKFHSDWLNMIYARLRLAKNLLSEDGVIFVSIDDNEQANLKKICDEIFGENNYLATYIKQSKIGGGSDSKFIVKEHEYCLVYAKSYEKAKEMFISHDEDYLKRYKEVDENGRYFWDTFARPGLKNPIHYDIIAPDGSKLDYGWIHSRERFEQEYKNGIVRIIKKNDGNWSVQFKQYLNALGKKPRSMTMDFGGSIEGKNDIKALFDNDKIFSYPKSVKFIETLVNTLIDKDEIVLDFFSGSATTAHAIMHLNAIDKGSRKYIMVQLPEKVDDEYETICDIGEERIRRAAKKIKEETNADIDYGFRVYKIDSSNMKDVYYEPNKIDQQTLANLESNIKEDRTPEDLLTQVILDLGLTLDLKIEEKEILGNKVFFVEDNALVACFDDNINEDLIDEIAKVMPLKVVLRDSSFGNDSAKINFMEGKIKEVSPDTEICVL